MKFIVALLFILNVNLAYASKAIYKVTIESNWNQMAHLGLPGNAHFSPIVAINHNANYSVFKPGMKATNGFEQLAELGRSRNLVREIKKQKRMGNVGQYIVTQNQFVLRQPTQIFEIEVTKKHPYISFVSMIAPSPDWVIGLEPIKLYSKSANFCETVIEKDLFAYDAGTEEGDFGGNFSLNNQATSPLGALSMLTGTGFNEKFATLIIERIQ